MNIVFSPAFFVYAELWEVVGQRQNADAQFSQALKYICRGTQTAMTKAFVLLKRSASRGFTEAQFAAGAVSMAAEQSLVTGKPSAGTSGRRTT